MFSGPIEDRLAIRELHDSYCDAVLRTDADDWGALWTEDAVWSLMGTEVVGRDNIVKLWVGAMAQFDSVSFLGIPGSLEITGNTATGRYQTHELLVENGEPRVAGGRYDDEFIKIDGQWFYTKRIFNLVSQMGGQKL
ncbi:nuclear transport factor 2 family protein [Parasphingorhabdus sp. JC815]|uniref:nuclear transport factor 2 family protein n=1 Tax=Parasphingorhabdus sp. JC815 TaxID=3232140 RepID=UPI0034594695